MLEFGRRMSALTLAFACVALVITNAHAEDLLDVYRLARADDAVLASAEAARAGSHDLAAQARASLLPQAAAAAGVGRERDSEASRPSVAGRTTNVILGLTQVVFDFGLWSQLRSADAIADGQDATFRAAQQSLCLRVATAYFDALLAADQLATVRANEDAFALQVTQTKNRYEAGLFAQVDVDQSRVYQALAHGNTLAARQALADAEGRVAEITGQVPGQLKSLRDDLPLTPPAPGDAQAWVASALAGNPMLWAAQHGVEAADKAVDAAYAGHLPSVSAAVGLARPTGFPYGDSSARLATTVGLTVSVPLFAGGATQARLSLAVHQREGAKNDLESLRRSIVRATQEAYGAVVSGIGQVEATRASVVAARQSLEATRVGRNEGDRTQTDLLNAIQILASAQVAYSQARHQYILGRLQLLHAAGTLNEADLAAVNALLQ